MEAYAVSVDELVEWLIEAYLFQRVGAKEEEMNKTG